MLKVAFVGAFSASLVEAVRRQLTIPCDVILGGEKEIVPRLGDVDVMVTMAFSREMANAAPQLKLVQVPGAECRSHRPRCAGGRDQRLRTSTGMKRGIGWMLPASRWL